MDFVVNIQDSLAKEELKFKSIQACRTRVILTEEQVIEIFQAKLSNDDLSMEESKKIRAAQLAKKFGVSDKTIRDIWTGRTW
jgi:phage portal protein BeeE